MFILLLFLLVHPIICFPDRSTPPLFPKSVLKVVAELPERPGNIDVDPETGRVFFTFHPITNPKQSCKVCELKEKFKGFIPFGDQSLFVTPLSIRVMRKKKSLVVLDHRNLGETEPCVHIIELQSQKLLKTYYFPSNIAGKGSMVNDFVVSKDENFLFIADVGISNEQPSIITLNLRTWTSSKSLVNHESTRARDAPKDFMINKVPLKMPFQIGVDSIGLSPDGNTLYFGAIFDPFMWMVPTRSLVQGNGEPERIVDVAFPKPISDGIVIDEDTGILYLTDFEHSSIWITDPTIPGRQKNLIHHPELLRWPDGLCAARGYLWITASALEEILQEPPISQPPYHILRLPLVKPEQEEEDELNPTEL